MREPRRTNWRTILLLVVLGSALGITRVLGQEATPSPAPPAPTASSHPSGSLPSPPPAGFGPVTARAPYRLVLLVPFPDDPFWQAIQKAVAARATTDGVTVDVVTLAAPSAPDQVAQLVTVIGADYDGILLGPVDAAGSVPGIVAANAAGVPVVAIDVAPLGGAVVSVVRTDNVAAARLAGSYVAGRIGGKGRVLDLQGDLANPVAEERDRGLREALASFPGIEVVAASAAWDRSTASRLTGGRVPGPGTPVPADEELNAIVAANDQMAMGAAEAVDRAQADQIVVVGLGATTETLTAIQQGLLAATIAEFPDRAGEIAVDLMVRHLGGEAVPAAVDSGSMLVTRDTVDLFAR
jgi:ribose transport system substrate-binding protein